jgi:hypothetical protein
MNFVIGTMLICRLCRHHEIQPLICAEENSLLISKHSFPTSSETEKAASASTTEFLSPLKDSPMKVAPQSQSQEQRQKQVQGENGEEVGVEMSIAQIEKNTKMQGEQGEDGQNVSGEPSKPRRQGQGDCTSGDSGPRPIHLTASEMERVESDVFWLAWALLSDASVLQIRGLWRRGVPKMKLRAFQLSRVLARHVPRLQAHLDEIQMNPQVLGAQWFLPLFSYTLPLGLAMRSWDYIFKSGWAAVYRVVLVLLRAVETDLLNGKVDVVGSRLRKLKWPIYLTPLMLRSENARQRERERVESMDGDASESGGNGCELLLSAHHVDTIFSPRLALAALKGETVSLSMPSHAITQEVLIRMQEEYAIEMLFSAEAMHESDVAAAADAGVGKSNSRGWFGIGVVGGGDSHSSLSSGAAVSGSESIHPNTPFKDGREAPLDPEEEKQAMERTRAVLKADGGRLVFGGSEQSRCSVDHLRNGGDTGGNTGGDTGGEGKGERHSNSSGPPAPLSPLLGEADGEEASVTTQALHEFFGESDSSFDSIAYDSTPRKASTGALGAVSSLIVSLARRATDSVSRAKSDDVSSPPETPVKPAYGSSSSRGRSSSSSMSSGSSSSGRGADGCNLLSSDGIDTYAVPLGLQPADIDGGIDAAMVDEFGGGAGVGGSGDGRSGVSGSGGASKNRKYTDRHRRRLRDEPAFRSIHDSWDRALTNSVYGAFEVGQHLSTADRRALLKIVKRLLRMERQADIDKAELQAKVARACDRVRLAERAHDDARYELAVSASLSLQLESQIDQYLGRNHYSTDANGNSACASTAGSRSQSTVHSRTGEEIQSSSNAGFSVLNDKAGTGFNQVQIQERLSAKTTAFSKSNNDNDVEIYATAAAAAAAAMSGQSASAETAIRLYRESQSRSHSGAGGLAASSTSGSGPGLLGGLFHGFRLGGGGARAALAAAAEAAEHLQEDQTYSSSCRSTPKPTTGLSQTLAQTRGKQQSALTTDASPTPFSSPFRELPATGTSPSDVHSAWRSGDNLFSPGSIAGTPGSLVGDVHASPHLAGRQRNRHGAYISSSNASPSLLAAAAARVGVSVGAHPAMLGNPRPRGSVGGEISRGDSAALGSPDGLKASENLSTEEIRTALEELSQQCQKEQQEIIVAGRALSAAKKEEANKQEELDLAQAALEEADVYKQNLCEQMLIITENAHRKRSEMLYRIAEQFS